MGPHEHGGHCELEFDGLEIPSENILLNEGDGLKITQIRLGPARLTHCLRSLGPSKPCKSSLARWRSRFRLAGCSPCMRPGCSTRAVARVRKYRWRKFRSPTRST